MQDQELINIEETREVVFTANQAEQAENKQVQESEARAGTRNQG